MKLKDLIESNNTGLDAIKRAPIVDYNTGIRCLRIGDISNNRPFNEWGYTEVEDNNYNKFQLKMGDIIVARTGATIGVNKYIDKDYKSVYNNGLIRIRVKQENNPKYVYYLLQSTNYKNFIKTISMGTSTQPNMQMNDLLNLDVPDFDKSEQNKIVEILGKIDDKIELNNEITNNLYEISRQYFNSIYQNSKNSLINLEEIATFSQGKQVEIENQSIEREKNMKRFLRIVDFTNPNEPIRYVEDFGDRYYAQKDDIIMIRYGSQTCGKVVRGKEGIIANNMFKINLKDNRLKNYIYYYLESDEVQNYLTNSQNSSTMPSINFGIMNKLNVMLPNYEVVEKFNRVIEPIRIELIELSEQNDKLSELRDTLLPKLMNGEINLDNIEI